MRTRRRSSRTRRRPAIPAALLVAAALLGAWPHLVGRAQQTRPATRAATRAATAATAPGGEGWFAEPEAPGKPPLPETVDKAFVLPIREPISVKTFDALTRKALRCRAAGAELIILDMDTWGGQAMAALDIARMLKADLGDIRTVCYVRTRAVSAGALIAVACDEIVMTPVGKLGDCAPISMQGKLEGIEREKIETVLRTDFEESAQLHGYSTALARAMVSADLEVWLVRNKKTRELRYVLAGEYRGRTTIPPGLSEVKSNPAGAWELLRVAVPAGRLLTMNSMRAKEYGFAAAIVPAPSGEPLAGLRERYNIAGQPRVFEDTWSERVVQFLTSPQVAGMLFFLGLLFGYVEMHTPGFGVAGGLAIACFAILFGSRYLIGLAQWWEIALFVVGLILIVLELFVTPGFGVLGLSGAVLCVVGLLAIVVPNAPDRFPWPQTDIGWDIFRTGAMALAIGLLASILAMVLLARWMPAMPVANRLILAPRRDEPEPAGPMEARRTGPAAVGETGVVTQICRPAGRIRIGDRLVDAVAEGAFIPAGTRVKVVEARGNRVVIAPTEA